jgi:hypothetical protein
MIAQLRTLRPTPVVTQRIRGDRDAVGFKARRFRAGRVDASRDMEKAHRITGAEFDEIG